MKEKDFAELLYEVMDRKNPPIKKKKENPNILECGGKKFNIKWVIVDNEPYLSYIAWSELKEKMGEELYGRFDKFMRGQTCVEHGAYPCDVENFFRPKNQQFFD